MATKTFSSRADEADLAYADSVTRERFGMSFGQYCGSVLVNAVRLGFELPEPAQETAAERKSAAFAKLKGFAQRPHDPSIGQLSDEQVRNLIASRYE